MKRRPLMRSRRRATSRVVHTVSIKRTGSKARIVKTRGIRGIRIAKVRFPKRVRNVKPLRFQSHAFEYEVIATLRKKGSSAHFTSKFYTGRAHRFKPHEAYEDIQKNYLPLLEKSNLRVVVIRIGARLFGR